MSERDDPVTIGRRVQQLRLDRGLTQKQLAEPAYTPACSPRHHHPRARAAQPPL
jgi:hypothetical protein